MNKEVLRSLKSKRVESLTEKAWRERERERERDREREREREHIAYNFLPPSLQAQIN